uniref:Fibronectin type-III domain-containing protein n=1 Tax=Hucho hucho TaxID=62062 RepID=A0A4W5R2W4_9TELE
MPIPKCIKCVVLFQILELHILPLRKRGPVVVFLKRPGVVCQSYFLLETESKFDNFSLFLWLHPGFSCFSTCKTAGEMDWQIPPDDLAGHDSNMVTFSQPKSFDGDQHTMLSSDDVLPPPGDIQVLLLTSASVSLNWSSPQGVKGPHKFRVTWECDGETSSSRVKGGYHLKISSLQPGEKYQFSVATEGEDGRQSRCVSASVFTVVPPRDLKVDHVKDTSFTLHWTKAEGMEKVPQRFLISYCRPGTDLHTENTKDCHKTFSNLQPGTEYTVSVSTVLNNGEESEPVSTTICTILPAPDQLTVDSVDTTSAAVSWNQPPGLDQTQHHYQISYRCPGTETHITTTSSHSITLSDLKPATEYSVTVCTVLENGRQSQLVSTTLTTVLPAPDQLTVDSVDTTSAAVSWSQPPGLDQTQHHYQISYHCTGTETHITVKSSHSITLSDLKPATEYSVTVCTVLENGRQSQLVLTTLTTGKEAKYLSIKSGVD